MHIYSLLFLISIISSYLAVFREGFFLKTFSIVVFYLLFMVAAFRYETGYDWLVYKQFYDSLLQGEGFRISFEFGFQFFAGLLVYLQQDYYILQIISSLFACFSIYRLFSLFNIGALSVFPLLYLSTNFFTSQMGTIRYTIAISIFCLSFRWVLSASKFKYVSSVFVAMMFHSAALFFLVLYPIFNWVGVRRYALLIVGVSSVFLLIDRDIILSVFPFVASDGEILKENLIGKIFRGFIIVVIFLVCHLKRAELIAKHVSLYNAPLFSLVLYFLFSWSSVLSSRLVEPLLLVSIVGFYYALRSFSPIDRLFIISSIVFYFAIKMGMIFSGGEMIVFLPYQSVFFDVGSGDGMERTYQLYNSSFK